MIAVSVLYGRRQEKRVADVSITVDLRCVLIRIKIVLILCSLHARQPVSKRVIDAPLLVKRCSVSNETALIEFAKIKQVNATLMFKNLNDKLN